MSILTGINNADANNIMQIALYAMIESKVPNIEQEDMVDLLIKECLVTNIHDVYRLLTNKNKDNKICLDLLNSITIISDTNKLLKWKTQFNIFYKTIETVHSKLSENDIQVLKQKDEERKTTETDILKSISMCETTTKNTPLHIILIQLITKPHAGLEELLTTYVTLLCKYNILFAKQLLQFKNKDNLTIVDLLKQVPVIHFIAPKKKTTFIEIFTMIEEAGTAVAAVPCNPVNNN